MINNLPFVSIIIPCRNEEKFIEKCLKTLTQDQTYPKEKLEFLVVDGDSEDNTREIIKGYHKEHPEFNIKIFKNSNKFTPFGLNIGIKEAKGGIIIKADAHTQYPPKFVEILVNYLNRNHEGKRVDVVGGQIITPSVKDIKTIEGDENKQMKMRAIALCLSHPFGSASRFRIGAKKPCFVDTVFGVGYRKKILEKIKRNDTIYFNEKLRRSQDLELNLRIQRVGGNILLVPEIQFKYYPKSNFKEFFLHNFEDGIWATYPLKFGTFFKLRHYLPFLFTSSLIISFILGFLFSLFWGVFFIITIFYLLVNIYFSYKISRKENNFKYMLRAFICRHFGYGLGSIWGLVKIFGK